MLLELGEELAVLGEVWNIDENASQIVAKGLSFVLPEAMDDLRLVETRQTVVSARPTCRR